MTTIRRSIATLCCVAILFAVGCEELPDLDGQDSPNITFTGPQPRWISWSKSSDAITYELAGQLIVARGADLKDAKAITGSGVYAHPAWSPDGKWVAHDHKSAPYRGEDIWARSATQDALPRLLTGSIARDVMPSWSADGAWIAFHSSRNPVGHVWLLSADGDGNEPEAIAPASSEEGGLAWSPTGARLAFVSLNGVEKDIWVADAATKSAERFGGTPASDKRPRWRPDGKAIGFIAGAGAGSNVWMQEDAPDAELRQLTDVGGVDLFDWIMDGRAIMYLTNEDKVWALKLEERAEPVFIRDTSNFSVSPDGRRYVYVEPFDNVYRHYAGTVPSEFLP